MAKYVWIILLVLLGVGRVEAQVVPGTVNSKALDGVGNKITSTVVGPARGLDVNVLAGGGGGSAVAGVAFLSADGIANQTLNAIHGFGYMYNGVTWDRIRGTIAGGLEVNCVTGCAGGSSTPSDAFVNPVTAGIQQTFNMVYNGLTWDRLRGTVAGGALVNISNASLAVTGTFFQATQPVSGTVAVSNAFLLDATFTGRINTLGQKAMVASTPVVLASDQSSIPITVASLPLPLGAATEATLATRLAEATFTGRFAAAYVDADTIANQTTTAVHGQCYLYNGATWDRCRGTIAGGMLVSISNATLAVTQSGAWTVAATQSGVWSTGRTWTLSSGTDSVAATVTGTVAVSNAFLLDATYTGRMPAGASPADNESNTNTALSRIGTFSYIFDGVAWDRWTGAVSQSGTWNVNTLTSITNPVAVTGTFFQATQPVSIAATVTVQGAKTNNNAAPGATNVGTLPCVATAVAPTQTEGNQVGCSVNLGGATRTIEQNFVSTANNDGACASGAASFTALASNASRTWAAIWASPANTDDVFIKLGATATSADARFAPGQPLNFTSGRIYTGVIDVFPASGTQAVCVMELN